VFARSLKLATVFGHRSGIISNLITPTLVSKVATSAATDADGENTRQRAKNRLTTSNLRGDEDIP
jgi:hypothetical protein